MHTFVVDKAVPVFIHVPDDGFDLSISQLLTHLGHGPPQLADRDEPVPVLVERPEGVPQLLVARNLVLHLGRDQGKELFKLDCPAC